MNIEYINQDVEYIGRAPSNPATMLKQLESFGRLCWKSEPKEDSNSLKFVKTLISRGHTSVLEHSNITLLLGKLNGQSNLPLTDIWPRFFHIDVINQNLYLSGSLRSWLEHHIEIDKWLNPSLCIITQSLHNYIPEIFEDPPSLFKYFYTPIVEDEQTGNQPIYIFKMTVDRGISHEIVRHRTLQFTQESTRYVNYMNHPIRIIIDSGTQMSSTLRYAVDEALARYEQLLHVDVKPEIARDVLPHCIATDMIVSGRLSAWKHFYKLRYGKGAHPRIREVAFRVNESFLQNEDIDLYE